MEPSKQFKVAIYEDTMRGGKITLWDKVNKTFIVGKLSISQIIGVPRAKKAEPKPKPPKVETPPQTQGMPRAEHFVPNDMSRYK